ncbi:hypothetical protein Q5752_006939 [Cryptotrichosporon argae]
MRARAGPVFEWQPATRRHTTFRVPPDYGTDRRADIVFHCLTACASADTPLNLPAPYAAHILAQRDPTTP